MNEQRQDLELLRDFAGRGDQTAFAAVVRRHLDLVYATALRRLEDAGAAEEVAQNVFAALARKAWRFALDDSLPAWLYRATLLEASSRLRSELRRRRREEKAVQLGTTMNSADEDQALGELVPLLDEALLALREKDRAALLLRYYEKRSLREVGAALGIGEDAAQKRVAVALEHLARIFQGRGFRTVSLAATAAVLQRTAVSAPAVVAETILQRVLPTAPSAVAGVTMLLSKLFGLTKGQTAALCIVLASAPVAWEARQARTALLDASAAQATLESGRAEHENLSAELERLRSEAARLTVAFQDAELRQISRQEAFRQVASLRDRVLGLLTATNYRWPDDLPFVRIPKATLREIGPGKGIDREGHLSEWSGEFLSMGREERQQVEESLAHFTGAMAEMAASRAYETNFVPPRLNSPEWLSHQSKSVAVPALGVEAKAIMEETLGRLGEVLGEDRAQLLLGEALTRKNGAGRDTWLGACIELSETPQLFTAFVKPGGTDGTFIGVFRTSQTVSEGSVGAMPGKTDVRLWGVPSALDRFFDPWLHQLGLTNLDSQPKP